MFWVQSEPNKIHNIFKHPIFSLNCLCPSSHKVFIKMIFYHVFFFQKSPVIFTMHAVYFIITDLRIYQKNAIFIDNKNPFCLHMEFSMTECYVSALFWRSAWLRATGSILTLFCFCTIPFRWAIKISGVREITIELVSVSTTIVSRSGPMTGKGNKTRLPRKRRPILSLNLRRGKDPGVSFRWCHRHSAATACSRPNPTAISY